MVAEYFETESFGVRAAPIMESEADVRAREILKSTTCRVEGRYQTGLLWKRSDIQLPDSYSMALKRLAGVEAKMRRDTDFAVEYNRIISSYVMKDYARKLSPEEAALTCNRTWYLPHFAVKNPNKPGKLRMVFDAAAEVDGVSLNSQLMKGPQEYRSLPAILFHFREGATGVCGDIKEMFHQVLVQRDDRCAQRFLWRQGDTTRQPEVYEMRVMTFGAACSLCAANYVKTLEYCNKVKSATRAVKSILDYHYADDYVDSFDTEEEAADITKQVRAIHKMAGFDLCNFASNSLRVTEALNGDGNIRQIANKEGVLVDRVLGLFWQASTDTFGFKLRTTAWVLRFIDVCRRRKPPDRGYGLTAKEVETAKLCLCRLVQRGEYAEEFQHIESGRNLPRTSSLIKLSPYIDEDGVLRVRGRIEAASWLPISARRPIILPPKHCFSNLVAMHYHVKMHHQNLEATICEIRRLYWIPRLRSLLRSIVANCAICRLRKIHAVSPLMGPLPIDRLTPYVRPFSYTGLDYFGPITVTVRRANEKRWVALFTCLTVRAVHLELAHDLSTDSCIIVLRNFINRRGVPVRVRSDNGKNFVGADMEAKCFSEVFDWQFWTLMMVNRVDSRRRECCEPLISCKNIGNP
ncbi:uncharacterized protein LOC128857505 [Anastrepha ludens]|uniref:uncharacterized protein LOC128857505 n=1 Tax=Anastrepha ludens TaxID=28586 RepID=UPI0023B0DB8F|nr:uncharacterized protein LOC128857505 [Anastrepha ludens]